MMSDNSSLTWSAHLRIICQLYKLPDPLLLINSPLWPKARWMSLAKTRVMVHHESIWRSKAANNSRLNFFNVKAIGLAGRTHPVLSGILTPQEVTKSRIHIKMLAGDYPCQAFLYADSAACRLCQGHSPTYPAPTEDMVHLLTRCRSTSETRTRVLPDLLNAISQFLPSSAILDSPSHTVLTQFLLDPTSLNLPLSARVSTAHPVLPTILTFCRNICFAIHKDRIRQLRLLKHRALGEPSLKKTGKFGTNSQLGLTPPPPRIIQTFLNFRHF